MPRNSSLERWAMVVLLFVALVAFAVQLAFDSPAVGALGLVLLAVPAYGIARSAGPRPLGWPEIVLVTLGLALAITVLIGTIASLFPAGLNARSIAALELPILAAVAIRWAGTSQAAPNARSAASDGAPSNAGTPPGTGGAPGIGRVPPLGAEPLTDPATRRRLPVASIVLGAIGISLAAGGVAIAAVAAEDQSNPAFVQLWALPGRDGAAASVGIHNVTRTDVDCRLAIDRPDRPGLALQVGVLAPDQTLVSALPAAEPDETAPWRLLLECTGTDGVLFQRQATIEPPR